MEAHVVESSRWTLRSRSNRPWASLKARLNFWHGSRKNDILSHAQPDQDLSLSSHHATGFQNSESERKRFSEKGCQAKKLNHDELKIPKIGNYQKCKKWDLSERCRHEERPRLGSGLRLPCAQYCNMMISLAINNLWDLPKCTKEGGKVCGMGGAQCTLSPESSSKNEAPMLVVGCWLVAMHKEGDPPSRPLLSRWGNFYSQVAFGEKSEQNFRQDFGWERTLSGFRPNWSANRQVKIETLEIPG